jgi:hypothetical protein
MKPLPAAANLQPIDAYLALLLLLSLLLLQKQQKQQQQQQQPSPQEAASSSAPEVPVQPVTREFSALGSKVVESNVPFKGPEDEPDFWEGNQFEVRFSCSTIAAQLHPVAI